VKNYRDESFVSQFLSPALIRKWHLFEVTNNESDDYVTITGIQDIRSYNQVRQSLSYQYSVTGRQPNIQVVDANLKGSRELKLTYTSVNGAKLGPGKAAVLNHIRFLWGYDVSLTE
jgi:spore cortex formation protein SpoVR/YcgB (stage V sporulation)